MKDRIKGALAFLHHEAAGGVVLLLAAIAAVVLSNSALEPHYSSFLSTRATLKVGDFGIDKPILLWINDGLMAIFFFLVGMEIKRELLTGELASFDRAVLPAVAAFGGMFVPAAVYALINAGDPVALRGWAIPAATDIAFAVGLLAVLGSRVPPSLKVFLLALAIIDDLGAIVIIALFYTHDLSTTALQFAATGVAILVVMNLRGVSRTAPYVLVGIFVWFCVLKSGVHATLAGVVVGLSIPLRAVGSPTYSPLEELEHKLHSWVAFGVLPLFAFANSGLSFSGMSLAKLAEPIPLGIAMGLFFGKQIGVVGATWIAVKTGFASKPEGASWQQIYGIACVAGIGFTMSLFIGSLAFTDQALIADVRLGVLVGSIASALLGFAVLYSAATISGTSTTSRVATSGNGKTR